MSHDRIPVQRPCGPDRPSVSVVIPALNEERNLPHVFAKLPADVTEVILVDGGSVDRTVAVARELRPDVVVVQQTRTGKGNALACGFAACTGDIIVMIDADGSTDPAEIPLFVETLRRRRRLRQGLALRHGRPQPRHHPAAQARQRRRSTWSSTCCSGPGSPTSATATTPSGAGSCRPWTCPTPDLPPPSRRQQALGRRVRDRDHDQHPGRGRRHERSARSRSIEHASGSTARATSTRSATASGCCAPSSASTAGCAPTAAPRRLDGAAATAGSRPGRRRLGRRPPPRRRIRPIRPTGTGSADIEPGTRLLED